MWRRYYERDTPYICHYTDLNPDPLDSIKIQRRTVVIKHDHTAGNYVSKSTHKWQLRNGAWYLIGKKSGSNMDPSFGEYKEEDHNLLTGFRIFSVKELMSGKTIKTGKTRDSSMKPVRVEAFHDFE